MALYDFQGRHSLIQCFNDCCINSACSMFSSNNGMAVCSGHWPEAQLGRDLNLDFFGNSQKRMFAFRIIECTLYGSH